jgi:hypothetical protein
MIVLMFRGGMARPINFTTSLVMFPKKIYFYLACMIRGKKTISVIISFIGSAYIAGLQLSEPIFSANHEYLFAVNLSFFRERFTKSFRDQTLTVFFNEFQKNVHRSYDLFR